LRKGYITNNPARHSKASLKKQRSGRPSPQSKVEDWSARQGAIGRARFCLPTTLARGWATWQYDVDSIDWKKRLVTFRARQNEETRKTLVIPLHPELDGCFWKARHRQAFLFPSLRKRTGGKTGLSGQLQDHGCGGHRGTINGTPQKTGEQEPFFFHSGYGTFQFSNGNAGVSQRSGRSSPDTPAASAD